MWKMCIIQYLTFKIIRASAKQPNNILQNDSIICIDYIASESKNPHHCLSRNNHQDLSNDSVLSSFTAELRGRLCVMQFSNCNVLYGGLLCICWFNLILHLKVVLEALRVCAQVTQLLIFPLFCTGRVNCTHCLKTVAQFDLRIEFKCDVLLVGQSLQQLMLLVRLYLILWTD